MSPVNVLINKFFRPYYEDGDPTDPSVETPVETPVEPPVVTPPTGKTFTQEEVNKFLAEDKRKHKVQTEKIIQELETLKKNKSLSEKEKEGLQSRIDELQAQIMTKDQILEQEKKKLQSQYTTELQRERGEKDAWKSRYTEASIVRSLTDAAVEHEAFSPEQIVAFLQPQTRLVEEIDAEGRGTGSYTPRVRFRDSDAEGKPTTLDLSVKEAVKRMKDLPDRFGNLFKSGLVSGLGGSGGVGSGRSVDLNKIKTVEEYKKHRDKILRRPTNNR